MIIWHSTKTNSTGLQLTHRSECRQLMNKLLHEIRDPVHVFVKLDSDERKVLDSRPFQRLRFVHQLALTYLIYPGATHKRFEHSLGAMELVGRVFDIVCATDALTDDVRNLIPEIVDDKKKGYWKGVVRTAAMCHDIGHVPFSHAAEDLLPDGWDHERLTKEILSKGELEKVWGEMTPPLKSEHIAKLAVGRKKSDGGTFSNWEAILSELIVSDVFGVDRMDYLLRDSLHTGVAYGNFDHHRLISTLRILAPRDEKGDLNEPQLGVEIGGLQAAESLLLARYLMFSQVYYHPIRLIYDEHLKDFLKLHLEGEKFEIDLEKHAQQTDLEIVAEMNRAAHDKNHKAHEQAARILCRKHYRVVWERNPDDTKTNVESGDLIYKALSEKFGEPAVKRAKKKPKGETVDFPILMRDGQVVSALSQSEVLNKIPQLTHDYIYIAPEKIKDAQKFLQQNKQDIIKPKVEELV